MATLHIRNVPETLYQRLQNLAAQEHRSPNAQVITLQHKAALVTADQKLVERLVNTEVKVLWLGDIR